MRVGVEPDELSRLHPLWVCPPHSWIAVRQGGHHLSRAGPSGRRAHKCWSWCGCWSHQGQRQGDNAGCRWVAPFSPQSGSKDTLQACPLLAIAAVPSSARAAKISSGVRPGSVEPLGPSTPRRDKNARASLTRRDTWKRSKSGRGASVPCGSSESLRHSETEMGTLSETPRP
jgi:hypothetical protein